MTCAGIASLAIARDELRRMKAQHFSAADEGAVEEMIVGGWAWLDLHWGVDRNPGLDGDEWEHYWLYSLERAGLLTGVKIVNGKDWYFDGATELFAQQEASGAWKGPGDKESTTPTCFALLFLKRATAPAAATAK
jgi:hypothetical protein